jgi:hypothetical protein
VMGTASWEDGDVNYDGSVTIADFIDLAANFGSAYDAAAAVNVQERDWEAVASFASAHGVAVPEPALAGAVLAGALMMVRRPRSRKR